MKGSLLILPALQEFSVRINFCEFRELYFHKLFVRILIKLIITYVYPTLLRFEFGENLEKVFICMYFGHYVISSFSLIGFLSYKYYHRAIIGCFLFAAHICRSLSLLDW